MQMEESFKDCKKCEEEIFWTHFQFIHFSQFLHGDFIQRLKIPDKFVKNMKKKLPEIVTLKGPSGVIWDAGLTSDDEILFFDAGWKSFVKDHSLVENDFLIFKYNGISHFDVLIFDGKSLCEKASCYFVRKCMPVESDCNDHLKRKVTATPDEIMRNSSQCGNESSPGKSIKTENGASPSSKPINSAASNKKKMKKKKIRDSNYGTWSIPPKRSLGRKELTFPGDVNGSKSEHTTMDVDDFGSCHATGKRVATQIEKTNVLLKAREALTNESLMIVMKPSHVARTFYVSVPIAWAAKHLSLEKADVILRMDEHEWKIRFNYQRNCDRGWFSTGWKNFVYDNHLEEHDVCVFERANIGKKPIILNVNIFHVLQGAVPPTK